MSWKLGRWAAGVVIGVLVSPSVIAAASHPLEIRVVVVTTFEVGNDTGDEPGSVNEISTLNSVTHLRSP